MSVQAETQQQDDRVRVDLGAARQVKGRQLLVRFAAGAAASLVAGVTSSLAGPRVSGPLLALPAILIASLTLIDRKEGRAAARDDARGAVLGGLALIVFAVVAAHLLGRTATWLALLGATAAWAAVAVTLFLAQRRISRVRRSRR